MSALSLLALLFLQTGAEEDLQEPAMPEPAVAEAAQEEPALPKGESRLITLDELKDSPAETVVTVLYHCKKADAVTASRSVMQSFTNPRAVRVQPDARANAVFLSGASVVVREAVRRMDALDAIQPKEPMRPMRVNQTAAEGPMDVIDSYNADAASAQTSIGFLIAGLIGLSLVGILLARRWVR
jgi:hypothetical protein